MQENMGKNEGTIAMPAADNSAGILEEKRVAFVGKLASMARRDAAQLAREHGATVLEKPNASAHLIVVGENDFPLPETGDQNEWFDDDTRRQIEQGAIEVITETQLWQRLGLVDSQHDIHRLYTPAMLADLLRLPVAVIRRWHRRGLIVPVREVRRLPYFDFQEVATAKRLAELLAAGVSPRAMEKQLAAFARYLPDVARPLAQLSVIVEGKGILLRQGDGLIEPGGQLRFDFDAWQHEPTPPRPRPPRPNKCAGWPPNSKRTANWRRPPRCTARRWPPRDRRRKSVFKSLSCSIARAISPAPVNDTTWPSSWTRITSRPERISAACWPRRVSTIWRWRRSRGRFAFTPITPTFTTISLERSTT